MPYKIRKVKGGFKVVEGEGGNRPGHAFSEKPLTKEQALKQLAALHIHSKDAGGKGKAG